MRVARGQDRVGQPVHFGLFFLDVRRSLALVERVAERLGEFLELPLDAVGFPVDTQFELIIDLEIRVFPVVLEDLGGFLGDLDIVVGEEGSAAGKQERHETQRHDAERDDRQTTDRALFVTDRQKNHAALPRTPKFSGGGI